MSKGGDNKLTELAKGNFDFGAGTKGGKAPFNMTAIGDVLKPSIEDFPAIVQRRIKALKNLHKDHLALEKMYREEVEALDRKYHTLFAPLYTKRASVVKGEYEPTDAEVRTDSEELVDKIDDKEKDTKGIPNFWLTAMKNKASIGDTITANDEDALSYLQDIKYTEGNKSFALTFHFAENPYFTDSVLTKTYHLAEDDSMYGEPVFDHAEGTKIAWKAGKNLTVKIVKVQQKARAGRGRKGGVTRSTTVEEPCESFFHFFSPPSAERDEAADEEAEALLDDMLEVDFETGCIFKDKIIPYSVLWFTGEAQEFEDDFDDFDYADEEDDEDDDDDDDDDEEEEEEEEEEEKPRKGRGGGNLPPAKRGGGAGAGQGRGGHQLPAPTQKGGAPAQPQQPECKQQ